MQQEERHKRLRKLIMIGRLPLEGAMAFVNVPLYGLTEEACGLRPYQHVYGTENRMRLEYYSPQYELRENFRQTFLVESCLYGETEHQPSLPLPMLGARIVAGQFPGQDHSHVFVAKEAVFTIDGKCFKGTVGYYTVPLCYSIFALYRGRIGLSGEALGPSLEELILILESLRMLNGKEVE